ncbi:hypothetical protein A5668_09075 [Mycolicibacterium fortuitum]|uniref:hypothetical protein n=1 Tax=Mycolicibacterium fortuitum TaxID=1766 RepID=UPI0007EBC02B|nr:hypothetical protein [Mycolicibacterium fortuitum]OBA94645.1 hypothetical protein A5668_09075 [Mycolicibacterium fortuitum]
MKITAEPRSDQWNADDFIGGAKTFTISGVRVGSAEQKYDIQLEGQERAWRPPLTMLRLLMHAWGDESDEWIGRRVTLYRDESVRFGSDEVGGIRISHMSNLPGGKPLTVKLTKQRGRRQNHTVQPLPDVPPPIDQAVVTEIIDRIAAAESLDALKKISAELKAWELGEFRDELLTAWSERQAAIKAAS